MPSFGAIVVPPEFEQYSSFKSIRWLPKRIAAVRGILGIPEGYVPLNIVPVGYPAEDPQPKDKWDEKKVHYDIW